VTSLKAKKNNKEARFLIKKILRMELRKKINKKCKTKKIVIENN
jgi:hypothetical protein